MGNNLIPVTSTIALKDPPFRPLKRGCYAEFWYTIWTDSALRPTALKVALVVGSLLFAMNHGSAVLRGEMICERWLIGLITYLSALYGQYPWTALNAIATQN